MNGDPDAMTVNIGRSEDSTPLPHPEVLDEGSWEIVVTSVHPSRMNDYVVLGRDEKSDLLLRILIPARKTPRDPAVGEAWRVAGTVIAHPVYGPQIHANVALPIVSQGRAIVRYLASDKRFPGIGRVTAGNLWERFGERLYDHIHNRNLRALADVVGASKAVAIVEGFGMLCEEVELYRWFDRYGLSPRVAGAAVRLWGAGAVDRVKADPYVMTLLERWKGVDERALRLGVGHNDERRLSAAVEEALSMRFRAGHMASPIAIIAHMVRRLLAPWGGDPIRAIDVAIAGGRVISTTADRLQSRACRFMEDEIARLVTARVRRQFADIDGKLILDAIGGVERETGYRLTEAQREAVFMASTCGVCVISGGAGTGKTTVVRAILAALEALRDSRPADQRDRIEHLQVALAGRAVKRISEATGRPASTLSRLVHEIENAGRRVQNGAIIFDESSMLDTPTLYRILTQVSVDANLIFVGDPGQLPPIGPGLPFHTMAATSDIPSVTLDVVHRQKETTGIPVVASSVRHGRAVELRRFDPNTPLSPGVFLWAATNDDVMAKTVAAFRAMCGPAPARGKTASLHNLDVQILTQVKNGPAGSRTLNRVIEAEYMAHQPHIEDWGLSIGSKIAWLKNDYTKAPLQAADGSPLMNPATGKPLCAGFMNGSLGTIQKHHPTGVWMKLDDGSEDAVTAADLEKLTHGWAISIHKAQGSAFRRVIVPIVRTRMLDRTMIYTAITRAIETVVLVGDPAVIHEVIRLAPHSLKRDSELHFLQAED